MKHKQTPTALLCALTMACTGAMTAWAADATPSPSPSPAADMASSDAAGLVFGSKIKGAEVKNMQSKQIGAIDELVVDSATGQVRFVVLDVAASAGISAKKVAVPWLAFQVTRGKRGAADFVLDTTKEKLEKAPAFDAKKISQMYARVESEPVFTYWSVTYLEPLITGTSSASPAASPAK